MPSFSKEPFPRRIGDAALLFAWTIVCYLGSFRVPFLFDGRRFIENDPAIRHLGSSWHFLVGTTRPVTRFTFALNYAAGGLHVFGYHLVNVGIHGFAALALYGLIRRTLLSPSLAGRFHGSSREIAFFSALLWAVHPLQTESVTYIFQRAESLMGLAYLLTMYAFARAMGEGGSRRRRFWLGCSAACCLIGMGAKPVMITAPLMVLLYDRFFWSGSWKEIRKARFGYYACLALTWIPLLIISSRPNESMTTVGAGLPAVSPWTYAAHQTRAVLHYLRLALWPSELVFDYGRVRPYRGTALLAASCAVSAMLAAVGWAAVRGRRAGFLGVWFFLALCPTSSFFPVADVIVEHRMYLSLAAVSLAAVLALKWFSARLPEHRLKRDAWKAVAWTLAVFLSIQTAGRNSVYRSRFAIWKDTVAKRPLNARAHASLGSLLLDKGDADGATKHLLTALRLVKNPWEKNYIDARAHGLLASVYLEKGRLDEAEAELKKAFELNPANLERVCDLAFLLASQGRLRAAVTELHEALGINPKSDMLHQHLAFYLERLGKIDLAVDHYRAALEINDSIFATRYGLGRALIKQGRVEEGLAYLRLAESIAEKDYPPAVARGVKKEIAAAGSEKTF